MKPDRGQRLRPPALLRNGVRCWRCPREFVEQRQLNLRARLELIAKICDAVNHAHQRGLIHRDLKPANILVDQEGQPKILDFGVARVTDSDAEMTRQTDVGVLIGTLAYMSPEQVAADTLDLDIRSDVYALGVIAYELLAGKPPLDTNRKALHEVVQAIQEVDPAPLSSINRIYRGDIETIVAKALEKDKARRYASAADLAADIRRYLTDQPIVARPPSTTYQLKNFARRHRALVIGAAAGFLVLTAGVVVSMLQAVRARRAETEAVAKRDRALEAEGVAQQERNTVTSCRTTCWHRPAQPTSPDQPRSPIGPEGEDGSRPGRNEDRGKVRQAAGGGGGDSRHHRAYRHLVRLLVCASWA